MCVIAYKPLNVAFPEERILKNCFENNPDGAGFMYSFEGSVHIHKGYDTFEAFYKALNKAREKTGDKVPYVMHFRIATQGYEKTMTHPFPLSSKMDNLKKLRGKCSIGVAHNGIIDLTSDGSRSYSDTMKFITDYLSLIIRGYDWDKDERTCTLIENLISGSRLAILDKNGHCKLLGKGWEESKGVSYSNNSYAREPYKWTSPAGFRRGGHWNDDWWDDWDYSGNKKWWEEYNKKYAFKSSGTTTAKKIEEKKPEKKERTEWVKQADGKVQKKVVPMDDWDSQYNLKTGLYEFDDDNCPQSVDNDNSYCGACAEYGHCKYSCASLFGQEVANAVEAAKAAASD